MIKQTLTWKDLNEVEHTQDFYFHLTKLEIAQLQLELEKWHARLMQAAQTMNFKVLIETYREIIELAAGVRSEDGANFIKTPEAKKSVMESPAIDELLWTFVTKTSAGIEFLEGLMPKEVQEKFRAEVETNAEMAALMNGAAVVEDNRPAWEKENRRPTPQEFAKLTPEQQKAIYAKVFGA
jgi:hypothetical protein